jgi:DNA-binding NarL/FixJ family response regulator
VLSRIIERCNPIELRAPKGPSELTPRELEVLVRVAHGMSNAEIGGVLFLSESTVKSHVGRLLDKLVCRDRTQLGLVTK